MWQDLPDLLPDCFEVADCDLKMFMILVCFLIREKRE